VKPASLAQDSRKETVYWHYRQRPVSSGALAVRTVLPPAELSRAATAAVAALDPELAVFDVQAMDTRIATSLGPQRAPMVLSLVFAAVAFTLAVIGIYGVLNWAVTQRVGEIGVRVALGARTNDIVRMIVTQGSRLIAIGAVLAAQIGNLRVIEPGVLMAAVAALASAALLASWLPARRASRIDPMRALRDE
jgi:putative ABC transport system permease protein